MYGRIKVKRYQIYFGKQTAAQKPMSYFRDIVLLDGELNNAIAHLIPVQSILLPNTHESCSLKRVLDAFPKSLDSCQPVRIA